MSKGSRQRKCQIDKDIEDMRWELISSKTSPERRQELLEILKDLEESKNHQSH
jgi:DNA invertase Pin-like site-specific DNA recombinase